MHQHHTFRRYIRGTLTETKHVECDEEQMTGLQVNLGGQKDKKRLNCSCLAHRFHGPCGAIILPLTLGDGPQSLVMGVVVLGGSS